MLALAAALLFAYLLGTLMGGQIIGALKGGVDLRKMGSGNVGATNALRTQGAVFAAGVLTIDVAKGVIAALLLPALLADAAAWPRDHLAYACGVAVALGHCYPVWYRFQGGKGVATLAGVFFCLLPAAALLMLAGFVLAVLLTGWVSLGTLMASLLAVLHVVCFDARGVFSSTGVFVLAMATLVVWKHRRNIALLWQGREHRFEKARVLGRWLSRSR